MANKNFKMTVRRRLQDGSLESAVYKLEHLYSTGDDTEQGLLLIDMEFQANGAAVSADGETRPAVRVWIEEDSGS